MSDQQLSKNFRASEFYCPCGCGEGAIHPRLIELLQNWRDALGVPIVVVKRPYEKWGSGRRCFDHNRDVGGSEFSLHLAGRAADCHLPDYVDLESAARIARELGFGGIGVYSNFIHVDIGHRRDWRGV